MKFWPASLLVVLALALPPSASAHLGNLSYADFTVRGSNILLQFRYAAHVTPGYPAEQEARVTRAQLLALEGGITAWLDQTVEVQSGGKRCQPALDNLIGPDSTDDLKVLAVWHCDVAEVKGFRVNFRALSAVMDDWQTIATAKLGAQTHSSVLTPQATRWTIGDAGPVVEAQSATSAGDKAAAEEPASSSFRSFFTLGVEHIWTGYDHLLFLLAVLLAGGGFARLAAIVTSFTIAHSITLGAAATGLIQLPIAPVEALIALSIVYVALENILDLGADRRAYVTFGFGLIHGFGFASVLAETAMPAGEILVPLLAFNLGVEGGQLAVVAAVVPLLALLLRGPNARRIKVVLSVLIGLAGMVWAAERISGIVAGAA